MEVFVEVFSQLGVPVGCLIATFWLWNKEREEHKTMEQEISKAIQNNTLALQKLTDKIDMEERTRNNVES